MKQRDLSHHLSNPTSLLVLALAIAGALYSINLVLVIAGIVAIYYVLRYVAVDPFSSLIARTAAATFIYTLLLAAVASVGDIVSSDFNITLSPLLVLILIGASLALYTRFVRSKSKAIHAAAPSAHTRADIMSILVALIVVIAIVAPPFLRYGVEGGVLAQMNANVDDSVHLAMINDRLHFHQDAYLDDSPETVRAEDKISYPATWHTANAVLINAVTPHLSTGPQTLILYAISKIAWTFIFVFFLARIALSKYSLKDRKSPVTYFYLGLLLFFSYVAATSQFLFGFYNFIPQLISLLILSSLTFSKLSSLQKRDVLLLGSVIAVGGGMVWFLLLPVMAVALIAMLFCSFDKHPFRETLAAIWQSLRSYPLIYVALAAAILQQLYVATMSSESLSFTEGIILSGEVARYSQLFFVMLTIGVAAYLFLWNKKEDADPSPTVWVTAALMLFAGFILAICLIKTQEPRYYYFKVLSAVVIVLIPFCVAGFAKVFQLLGERIDGRAEWPIAAIALSVIVISVLPSFISTGNILSYMKGERPTTSSSIDSVFKNLQPESAYSDSTVSYKLFYDHRSFPQNFINTMLVKANQPDSDCFRETLGKLISDHSALSMADTAAKLCGQRRVSIVVPKHEYPIIQDLFKQRNFPATVTVTSE